MSMIKIEDLSFSYPGSFDTIFDHVSFQLDSRWKLGFVGRNGRGKTTLLRLLQGQYEYQGRITHSVVFDYFPYPVPNKNQLTQTVLEEVCPQAQEWELLRELGLLNVEPEVLERPFAALSGGEQCKVLLAALFLNEGHFLLIDEPTNHLDAQGRALVSAYLRRKKGFILVSHDRRFLDGCVDHILSLNRSTIEVQSGTFSTWFENFQRRQQAELEEDARLKKDISRLQQAARRSSDWSDRVEASKIGSHAYDRGFVGHKAAKMMKRAKNIQARQEEAITKKSALRKDLEQAQSLKLSPLPHHAQVVAECSKAVLRYGNGTPVSFALEQGERLALTGPNGCGKSSLLKLLLGEDLLQSGTCTTASGLVISYVPQDTASLRGSLDDFIQAGAIDETLFKTILRKLEFERVQVEKDLSDYSEGQKKKVFLARSLCQRAHLYLWDEPLNYIDLYSRLQLEELLTSFQPTMLFVEHDEAFREAVATGSVVF